MCHGLHSIRVAAMYGHGLFMSVLREPLPDVRILEIGSGRGDTARGPTTKHRTVIPLEPDRDILVGGGKLPWVCGTAQSLPFGVGLFEGAYVQFTYFFSFHRSRG